MLASAIRSYINRFAVVPGGRLAIFTNTDDGWQPALDLAKVGVEVPAVIDSRPAVSPPLAAQTSGAIRILTGSRVVATKGWNALRAVTVRTPAGTEDLEVDSLAVSGGWDPAVHLGCHHGGRPVWNDAIAAFVPGSLPKSLMVAGAANGTLTLAASLSDGLRVESQPRQPERLTTK